jgi:hypothetical protein
VTAALGVSLFVLVFDQLQPEGGLGVQDPVDFVDGVQQPAQLIMGFHPEFHVEIHRAGQFRYRPQPVELVQFRDHLVCFGGDRISAVLY